MQEDTATMENPARVTMGAIVASALVAAVVAFLLRRALRGEHEERITNTVMDDIRDSDLRERAKAATGDFLRSNLAPELKPMILTVLKDVREYVDRGFQRAEKSVKDF